MRRPSLALITLLALTGCSRLAAAPPAADWVFHHGVVRTLDPARPVAPAIAVAGGQVVAVGDDAAILAYAGPRTTTIDLAGRAVVPGFHDGHVHPLLAGLELEDCFVGGDLDKAGVLAAVKAYAKAHPGKGWIRGSGWALTAFPGANPHKAWLDAVAPDRPVLLWAADGHSAWANSQALKLAGITRTTKDPAHGRIERDQRGEPTGTLRESAVELVSDLVPAYTPAERVKGLARGLRLVAEAGITSFVEANAGADLLATYFDFASRGALTARVVAAQEVDPAKGPAQVATLVAQRAKFTAPRLRPIAAKLFVDGVVEAKTAALLSPYVGGAHPQAAIAPKDLRALVVALDAAGFQVHMHAIGDGAVRAGLDAVAAARAANGARDARHTIAHLEMIDPADVPRFASLGVVASFQPYWAMRDAYVRDLTEPVLGPARSARLYPIASVWRAGGHVAFGSDWSVSSLDPLAGMQVAVTRRDPAEPAGPDWIPAEAVTPERALAGYTRQGAWQSFEEQETGVLAPGMAADLVVLAHDPLAGPPERIMQAKVQLTMLAGLAVYRAPTFSFPSTGKDRVAGQP